MLQKRPTPSYFNYVKKAAKILFIGEVLFFAGSYGLYYRTNRDRGKENLILL